MTLASIDASVSGTEIPPEAEFWLGPAIFLTVASALVGIALLPLDMQLVATAENVAALMFMGAAASAVLKIIALLRAAETKPTRALLAWILSPKTRRAALGFSLAAANVTSFLLIKTVLNRDIPFSADRTLADLDRTIFFGQDPWVLVSWLDHPIMPIIYHPGWIVLLLASLMCVFNASVSRDRTALILTYFVLWSLVGPIVHLIMPAAGPLFYEKIGLGDRFAAVGSEAGTGFVAEYLWAAYETRSLRAMSGISAMPSMHVTMVAWSMIVFFKLCRPWFPVVVLAGCLITLLSVALGWHYAVDGIVGVIAAVFTFKLIRHFLPAPRHH